MKTTPGPRKYDPGLHDQSECEVRLSMNLCAKVAAFCRELGDPYLQDMARKHDQEPAFLRAEESLRAGQIDSELEADLDGLDQMVRGVKGQGLYPSGRRTVFPGELPGAEMGTGAQWWTCPRGLCSGRGRVKPRQEPPVCATAGQPLAAGPLPG